MKSVTLTVLNWSHELPLPGHYVASSRGVTAFLVLEVKMPKKPCGYVAKLVCERRPRTELSDPKAIIHGWKWSKI